MKQLNFFEPVELQTRSPNGNKRLIDYGVQNENSDYRVHIGYKAQHAYIFPTQSAKGLLDSNHNLRLKIIKIKERSDDITAHGYPAPISLIDGMQSVLIPFDIYNKYPIHPRQVTTTKGARAVQITVAMLKRGLIPLPIEVNVIEDKAMQIGGTDCIIIHSKLKLQVKCDYLAGERKYGGTGNVFLQIKEANVHQLY